MYIGIGTIVVIVVIVLIVLLLRRLPIRRPDMIVVGSRRTGGFARLLMGSVSTQISHHAHCPVVIIPLENRG